MAQPQKRQPRTETERLRRREGEGREGYLRQREQHGKGLEVQMTWYNPESDTSSGGWGMAPGEVGEASRTQAMEGLGSPREDFGLTIGRG